VLRDIVLICLLILALRLPFLTQPIQGDDVYYLAGGQHALIEPAHPHRAQYLFQGRLVDMRGHPHPPLNAWILGALIAVAGKVHEPLFHAAYALFSLLAALGMYALARLYTPHALAATALFCAVPAFVVNGNSLESDLPFLAFWMLGMAAFFHGRVALSVFPLALAAMAAYQSVLAIPILWLHTFTQRRHDWKRYTAALAPLLAILLYQVWEQAPVVKAVGYFQEYGLQKFEAKLWNAAALTGHLGWMLFPALGLLAFASRWALLALPFAFLDTSPQYLIGVAVSACFLKRGSQRFGWWPHIFFAGSLVLFFAGSARYLLPLAAPLVLLAIERVNPRWLWPAVAAQMLFSLSLAAVNYQHWAGYREFVAQHRADVLTKRTWINGEWGLRFYAEELGALPLAQESSIQPGQLMLTSELGYPIPFTVGGGQLIEIARAEIHPALPFRLIGLHSRSGYSTASAGLRPFDLSFAPLDRIRLDQVLARRPTLSYLTMGAAESEFHIVSGAYQIENAQYRWISREAKFLVKPTRDTMDAAAVLYIPDLAPAREIELEVNGAIVARQRFPKPGLYTLEAKSVDVGAKDALVAVRADKTFQAPGDTRELGLILREVGLR
jgi:hypothetical protein